MKRTVIFILLFAMQLVVAQEIKIKQDDDAVLLFNEGKQTAEVWVRMQKIAFNEIILPGEMKKFLHPEYLTSADLEDSEVMYAYSYKALEKDIELSLNQFFKDLESKRRMMSRGYLPVNQPFYRTERFKIFLENPGEVESWNNLPSGELDDFVKEVLIPESRNLMASAHELALQSHENVATMVNRFITTQIKNESEYTLFTNQMNQLETYFAAYNSSENHKQELGSLMNNDFKIFTGNPGTDFGVYMTTNNLRLIQDYNYREMDTRGFNFEVYAAQRFAKARIGKRRTLNYYAAASYLSLKDKEFGLKKSFINLGPELRYTGYYENQVQLIAGLGLTADITAEKYFAPTDKRQFGVYAGGEISLLFIRLGMRYYSGLANDELMPEGNWFYRLGIVAKF